MEEKKLDKPEHIERGVELSAEPSARVEQEKIQEAQESAKEDRIIAEELKRELKIMEGDESLKKEAEEKANKIRVLAQDDKIKNLLDIVREKGVVFAVKVAKSMNDPYLLDVLHDVLAKEGYYKDLHK